MLWDSMMAFFKSWFNYPGLEAYLMLVSIVLAIAFAVIWLLGLQPRFNKNPGLWVVVVASAFLTVLAMTFIQIPLQYYIIEGMGTNTYIEQILLAGIPVMLVTGLVQEGAKMVPMVFWWLQSDKKIDPKMGLIIGAIAGAGFGVFEAVWAHNQAFMAGWTWDWISIDAVQALLPFWERFWTVAFHIAVSGIAGYGLAKGKGFPFYILAAVLHGAVNYLSVIYVKGILTTNQTEVVLAAFAALVMLAVLWLRWRKDKEEPTMPVEVIEPTEPDIPAETDV